ncbi:MAG: MarR family winged helix-turn-helix transcriptional regulator [Pseudomonadota bacterium]
MSERDIVPISENVDSETMGFLIYEVARAYTNAYATLMAPLGLTRPQARVMACVSRYPGITQVDLAEYIGIGRMAMSGLIDRMEAKDLVSRSDDPTDKRIKRIFLTKNAKKSLPQMREIAEMLYRESLSSVKKSDLNTTREVLSIIRGNLQQLDSHRD